MAHILNIESTFNEKQGHFCFHSSILGGNAYAIHVHGGLLTYNFPRTTTSHDSSDKAKKIFFKESNLS